MGQDRWYEENGRALCTSLECTHRYESDCGVKCHEMEGEVERYEQEPVGTLAGQMEAEARQAERQAFDKSPLAEPPLPPEVQAARDAWWTAARAAALGSPAEQAAKEQAAEAQQAMQQVRGVRGMVFGKPQPAFPREDRSYHEDFGPRERSFHEHPLLPGQAGAVIPKQGSADIVWSPAHRQWRLYVTAPGVPYLVIDVTEQIKAIIEAQQEFDDKDRS